PGHGRRRFHGPVGRPFPPWSADSPQTRFVPARGLHEKANRLRGTRCSGKEGRMIKLECPHCGKEISTGDANAGKKGKCPSCKGLLVIPTAPAPARAAVQPARKPGPPPPRPSRGRHEESDPDH